MIKKKYSALNRDKDYSYYTLYKGYMFSDQRFSILCRALNPIEDLEVVVSIVSEENKVYIYSDESTKEQADIEFENDEEENIFLDRYNMYLEKRWKEIPKLEISIQDWQDLQEKYQKIKKTSPKYLIYMLDDSGPLDKIDIFGKDELSEQDKEYIKQEHEKYLKYEKARQKYIQSHSDYSEVWRGPQDDEYEVDILKYYDQDE